MTNVIQVGIITVSYTYLFEAIYNNLDRFLFTILSELNKEVITLVICSDHGNFEDLSVKTHTMNPALTLTAGKNALQLACLLYTSRCV